MPKAQETWSKITNVVQWTGLMCWGVPDVGISRLWERKTMACVSGGITSASFNPTQHPILCVTGLCKVNTELVLHSKKSSTGCPNTVSSLISIHLSGVEKCTGAQSLWMKQGVIPMLKEACRLINQSWALIMGGSQNPGTETN